MCCRTHVPAVGAVGARLCGAHGSCALLGRPAPMVRVLPRPLWVLPSGHRMEAAMPRGSPQRHQPALRLTRCSAASYLESCSAYMERKQKQLAVSYVCVRGEALGMVLRPKHKVECVRVSSTALAFGLCGWTKTGIALLYDEVSENAYDIRLKLTKEVLTIQKQDVVCVSGSDHSANHRTVTLRRQPVGGLGLNIKGGAEHKVPVVISKIFKDQAADQTGMLFIGDAIIQVNGINVESATHEEVVRTLKNLGKEVNLLCKYLEQAITFLHLPLCSPGASSDHSSGASSPLFDSGLHLNGNSTNTAPSSASSPIANEPKYEKCWLDTLSVPLSMAHISRYKAGTDKLRSNAFEVLALDGVSTGILQLYTAQKSADCLRAISTNISGLTLQNMKMTNKCCSPSGQVIHMGWVNEKLEGTDSSQLYKFKFLALKGSSFYIFSTPPVSTLDWVRAEKIYNLCEVLFKIHKINKLGSDKVDTRQAF
ncbi:gamma-2-syntrophin-like [Dromaius novaehollandiae]|uniref:gamma-2-syntrophin-like n=1 Tax=Dromaius novaehollandiae TaxID=8790 RepID=UPI00311D4CC0